MRLYTEDEEALEQAGTGKQVAGKWIGGGIRCLRYEIGIE